MRSIRDLTTTVYAMKQEVNEAINTIRRSGYTIIAGKSQYLPDAQSKMNEAIMFLRTVDEYNYNGGSTVYELCCKIERRLSELKKERIILEQRLCRQTIFPTINDVVERNVTLEKLKTEISWLNKCLIICKTKNYFEV